MKSIIEKMREQLASGASIGSKKIAISIKPIPMESLEDLGKMWAVGIKVGRSKRVPYSMKPREISDLINIDVIKVSSQYTGISTYINSVLYNATESSAHEPVDTESLKERDMLDDVLGYFIILSALKEDIEDAAVRSSIAGDDINMLFCRINAVKDFYSLKEPIKLEASHLEYSAIHRLSWKTPCGKHLFLGDVSDDSISGFEEMGGIDLIILQNENEIAKKVEESTTTDSKSKIQTIIDKIGTNADRGNPNTISIRFYLKGENVGTLTSEELEIAVILNEKIVITNTDTTMHDFTLLIDYVSKIINAEIVINNVAFDKRSFGIECGALPDSIKANVKGLYLIYRYYFGGKYGFQLCPTNSTMKILKDYFGGRSYHPAAASKLASDGYMCLLASCVFKDTVSLAVDIDKQRSYKVPYTDLYLDIANGSYRLHLATISLEDSESIRDLYNDLLVKGIATLSDLIHITKEPVATTFKELTGIAEISDWKKTGDEENVVTTLKAITEAISVLLDDSVSDDGSFTTHSLDTLYTAFSGIIGDSVVAEYNRLPVMVLIVDKVNANSSIVDLKSIKYMIGDPNVIHQCELIYEHPFTKQIRINEYCIHSNVLPKHNIYLCQANRMCNSSKEIAKTLAESLAERKQPKKEGEKSMENTANPTSGNVLNHETEKVSIIRDDVKRRVENNVIPLLKNLDGDAESVADTLSDVLTLMREIAESGKESCASYKVAVAQIRILNLLKEASHTDMFRIIDMAIAINVVDGENKQLFRYATTVQCVNLPRISRASSKRLQHLVLFPKNYIIDMPNIGVAKFALNLFTETQQTTSDGSTGFMPTADKNGFVSTGYPDMPPVYGNPGFNFGGFYNIGKQYPDYKAEDKQVFDRFKCANTSGGKMYDILEAKRMELFVQMEKSLRGTSDNFRNLAANYDTLVSKVDTLQKRIDVLENGTAVKKSSKKETAELLKYYDSIAMHVGNILTRYGLDYISKQNSVRQQGDKDFGTTIPDIFCNLNLENIGRDGTMMKLEFGDDYSTNTREFMSLVFYKAGHRVVEYSYTNGNICVDAVLNLVRYLKHYYGGLIAEAYSVFNTVTVNRPFITTEKVLDDVNLKFYIPVTFIGTGVRF